MKKLSCRAHLTVRRRAVSLLRRVSWSVRQLRLTILNRMLGSRAMPYWRKFILVVVLALSLPAQSFAAASMMCGLGVGHGSNASPHTHHHHSASVTGDDKIVEAQGTHATGQSTGSHGHHHACSSCASCCFGAAAVGVSAPSNFTEIAHTIVLPSMPLPVVSFLTGGIERPPRPRLV